MRADQGGCNFVPNREMILGEVICFGKGEGAEALAVASGFLSAPLNSSKTGEENKRFIN